VVTSRHQLDEIRRASCYPKLKTILQATRVGTMNNNLQRTITLERLGIQVRQTPRMMRSCWRWRGPVFAARLYSLIRCPARALSLVCYPQYDGIRHAQDMLLFCSVANAGGIDVCVNHRVRD